MDTPIAESLKLMVTALLIALFLNVAGIIYNVNQANTFEKQAVQIMQKDGGLTPGRNGALRTINRLGNKQYGHMFQVTPYDPDPKKTVESKKDETVKSDTAAYFVPENTDNKNIATDVFEDIDHPNQLLKKDGDIDKSTIYAPAPTPQDMVRYKRELSDSDYQTYMSIVKKDDYNEALKFLQNHGINAEDNTFYTVQEGESVEPKKDQIYIPVYAAYNNGHTSTYKPVYMYGNCGVIDINGKLRPIDVVGNGKLRPINGGEITDANGKKVEVIDKNNTLHTIDGDKVLPPQYEIYSVIGTYNDKSIMINSNLLLTNTDIHPYGNKIHYWVSIHIPYIAFSKFKPHSGAVINHSYMGETVSKYGQAKKYGYTGETVSTYGQAQQ